MAPRSTRRYTTLEALALHESVSPDRWCVTRSDLKYLRQEVWTAIQAGEIQPKGCEEETECFDELYGPSIYTVTQQHIMPVTEQAGKVSWALMRHPNGLDCDVFISHAWQEGVFEFLAKVLHSWPTRARHAWCCMLANPQNLDIGALLQSPSSSPFALALRVSKYVLVVPNRHRSIYTRLWCGYEAYRAHEEGKTILVAQASGGTQIRAALTWAILAGLLGMLWGAGMKRWHVDISPALLWIVLVAAWSSVIAMDNTCRMTVNGIGSLVCGSLFFQWHTVRGQYDFEGFACHMPYVEQRIIILIMAGFFLLQEFDRANGLATKQEALQLSRGYQGTIERAACSQAADAMRIFEEIGQKTAAVDYAIHVLLKAGMSSPTLRQVASKGVDIQHAGSAEVAVPFIAFTTTLLTLIRICFDTLLLHLAWHNTLLQFISFISRPALLVILCRSPVDERCFILKMMTKLVLLYLMIACPLVVFWETRAAEMRMPSRAWFALPATIYSVIFFFACLGMRRLVAIPAIGPGLLQLFLARGSSLLPGDLRCCRSCTAESEATGDSSSNSSLSANEGDEP